MKKYIISCMLETTPILSPLLCLAAFPVGAGKRACLIYDGFRKLPPLENIVDAMSRWGLGFHPDK